MLAAARRSCRAAAVLSRLRSSPSLVVVGLAETQRDREDAFVPFASPPTQNGWCVCLLGWRRFLTAKVLCARHFLGTGIVIGDSDCCSAATSVSLLQDLGLSHLP